jgi:hypothetical protein
MFETEGWMNKIRSFCLSAAAIGVLLAAPAPAMSQVLSYAIDNQTAHPIRVDFCSASYQNRCWPSVYLEANRMGQFPLSNCIRGEQICYSAISPDGSVIAQDCSVCGQMALPAFVQDSSTASLPHDPVGEARALQSYSCAVYGRC